VNSPFPKKIKVQVLTKEGKKKWIKPTFKPDDMTKYSLEYQSCTQIFSEDVKRILEDNFVTKWQEQDRQISDHQNNSPWTRETCDKLLKSVFPQLQEKIYNEPRVKNVVDKRENIRFELIPLKRKRQTNVHYRSWTCDIRTRGGFNRYVSTVHTDFLLTKDQSGTSNMEDDYVNFRNRMPQCRTTRGRKPCFKLKFVVALNLWFPIENGHSYPLCVLPRKIKFGRIEGEEFPFDIPFNEPDPFDIPEPQMIFPKNMEVGNCIVFTSDETYHGAGPIKGKGERTSFEFRGVAYDVECTPEACDGCRNMLSEPACGLRIPIL